MVRTALTAYNKHQRSW